MAALQPEVARLPSMPEKGPSVVSKDRFDPLSPVTRRVRRNLLAWSLVSVAMSWANLVPTKIQAFGLETDHIDQRKLLVLLACVVLFEGLSFAIYGYVETTDWMEVFPKHMRELMGNVPDELTELLAKVHAHKLPKARGLIDYYLPLAFGLLAVLLLAHRAFCV
jgi:hypothetical protein